MTKLVALSNARHAEEPAPAGVSKHRRGAIWIPAAPAGERSPGHPDLDPVWRTLAEARVPFMLHVGAASPMLPPAYHRKNFEDMFA